MPTLRNRVLGTGADLSGLTTFTAPLTTTADKYKTAPDAAHPGQFVHYQFRFWNIGTALSINKNQVGLVANATAWYTQIGGGGLGPPVSCYAFDLPGDATESPTPIGAVSPASAWPWVHPVSSIPYPNGVDTVPAAVEIDALDRIGAQEFVAWTRILDEDVAAPADGVAILGARISVPQGGSGEFVASYRDATFQRPDDEVAGPGPWQPPIIGDSAFLDLVRRLRQGDSPISRELERALETVVVVPELMSRADLRVALTDLKGRVSRGQAAVKSLEAALKNAPKKQA